MSTLPRRDLLAFLTQEAEYPPNKQSLKYHPADSKYPTKPSTLDCEFVSHTGCPSSSVFRPKKVFVSFSDHTLTHDQLRVIFSFYGKLRQAYVCEPKSCSSPPSQKKVHRFGFVTFYDYKIASKLVKLERVEHQGISFKVKAIKYKPEFKNKFQKIRNRNW